VLRRDWGIFECFFTVRVCALIDKSMVLLIQMSMSCNCRLLPHLSRLVTHAMHCVGHPPAGAT
jgi:hypothetical protein